MKDKKLTSKSMLPLSQLDPRSVQVPRLYLGHQPKCPWEGEGLEFWFSLHCHQRDILSPRKKTSQTRGCWSGPDHQFLILCKCHLCPLLCPTMSEPCSPSTTHRHRPLHGALALQRPLGTLCHEAHCPLCPADRVDADPSARPQEDTPYPQRIGHGVCPPPSGQWSSQNWAHRREVPTADTQQSRV